MYNQCFPEKNIRTTYKNKKHWLTAALRQSIKVKNLLFFDYKKNPSPIKHNHYKQYRNKLNSLIRIAEKEYYQQLLEKTKSNLKKSWKIIRNIIKCKSQTTASQFVINNHSTSDGKLIVNTFNEYYVNIGTNLSKNIPITNKDPLDYISNIDINRTLYLRPTDKNEIKRYIINLKSSSAGWDGFHADIVKSTYEVYLDVLVHMINLTLTQGIFPNELKKAKVLPLYKSGDNMLIKNYRPVSVLSVFSKLFEHVIYSRLYEFLKHHDILYNLQFGFRKDHSTIIALTILLDKILNGFNTGNMTLGVFLDFSKAFDTVNHDILLKKSFAYGIRGVAFDLIKNYLDHREQFVSYNGFDSDVKQINSGVPQGSILGPLIFILYINDISNVSETLFPILFADDSNVFIQGNNLNNMVSTMNRELNKIYTLVISNKLSLNVSKTSYMIFKTRNLKILENNYVMIMGAKIVRVCNLKFLGIILDCHLSWQNHIDFIRKKISKAIGIILKARTVLSGRTLLGLYYTFLYPYINYGIEVWGNTSKINLDTVFKLQKKVLRIISYASYCSSSAPLFFTMNILNVRKVYMLKICQFMHKLVNAQLPNIVNDMFVLNQSIYNYNTRSSMKYHVPINRLTVCQKHIKYMGVIAWNFISDVINCNCSKFTFRKRLKKYLLNNDIPGIFSIIV